MVPMGTVATKLPSAAGAIAMDVNGCPGPVLTGIVMP